MKLILAFLIIISAVFVITVGNNLTAGRILSYFDCTGIDPDFNPYCHGMEGYKKICVLLICNQSKSTKPSGY